jgi:hypothetical protein
LFCDKKLQTINEEKEISGQKIKEIEFKYKTIAKRNKYLELIINKRNELIDWHKKTEPKRRRNYYYSYLIVYIFYPIAYLCAFALVFVLFNSDNNPITGRKCVYSIPQELIEELENDLFNDLYNKYEKTNSFIASTDDCVKRLDNCVNHLIQTNNDIKGLGESIWTPVVVNDDNVCDLIVIKSSGTIFAFKKMLDLCESDDELAYVLAHQFSHMLLDHKREPVIHLSIIYLFIYYFTLILLFFQDLIPKQTYFHFLVNFRFNQIIDIKFLFLIDLKFFNNSQFD